MTPVPHSISVSQLVAHNLTRIRKALGLSQEQAAARLEPYIGARWSKAVYSAAERSYSGKRVRQFTATELAAFALAFEVPITYFFIPPKPDDRILDDGPTEGVMIGERLVRWPDLFNIMKGGEARSAVQLRLDELPAKERDPGLHALAAAGIVSWAQVNAAGERSNYNPVTGKFEPAGGGGPS